MNTAVCKRFFTRFVAAALLATAGTLAPSALAAPSEAKVQESVVFTKLGRLCTRLASPITPRRLTTQSCTDTLESAMPKLEAKINPVFKENEAITTAQHGHLRRAGGA